MAKFIYFILDIDFSELESERESVDLVEVCARHPLQKSIVHDMWDRHATMAAWGSINDGTAVLRRRRGADAPGYGRASATSRKRVNSTCIRKGDLCAMVASPVSVPPPGI